MNTPDPRAALLKAAKAVMDSITTWSDVGEVEIAALAAAVRAAESAPPAPCPGCAALREAARRLMECLLPGGWKGVQCSPSDWPNRVSALSGALHVAESAPPPAPGEADRLRDGLRVIEEDALAALARGRAAGGGASHAWLAAWAEAALEECARAARALRGGGPS